MSGALVPYDGAQAVGLVESYRLNREQRQRNAAVERMGGNFALEEARRNLDAMTRRGDLARVHALAVEEQRFIAERTAAAVTLTGALVDHAVMVTAGDPVRATYVEPILDRAAFKLRQTI